MIFDFPYWGKNRAKTENSILKSKITNLKSNWFISAAPIQMETKNIIILLKKSFNGHAWHGPSVMEVLSDIRAKEASSRLSENTHSIEELVLHMAAWRNFVVNKLKGEEFEMTDPLNFPKPDPWEKTLSRIKQSQDELLDALRSFPENKLVEKVPGREYDFYTLLHGIIQHDIYHTGQIMLIKKSNPLIPIIL